MTRHWAWPFVAATLWFSPLIRARTVATSGAVDDRPLALIGATVIPMSDPTGTVARNATRLRNYTIVIRAGRIVGMGPSDSIALPADARRIDGRNRFVIPGLVDAHAHLLGTASSADLPLYLFNGITTVRNMYGEPYHVHWRDEIASGARLGPTLFTTSAFTDGITSPGKARAFVRQARLDGYDAVKIHLPLTPAVHDAIAVAAKDEGIRVVGHAPGRPLGVAAAVRTGQQTIEHAESIMQAETNEQEPDPADIPRIVALLRGSGICVTPTLVAFDHVVRMTEQYPALHEILTAPDIRYVRAELRADWAPSRNEYVTRWRGHESEVPGALAKFRRQYSWMQHLVVALAANGVPILAGSDASLATVIPGFSLHEELRLLVDAGMSPYAALRAATTDAARCLGQPREFGVVLPGARADLVLLDRDPLVDITAAAHPVGTVVRGRWWSSAALHGLIAR